MNTCLLDDLRIVEAGTPADFDAARRLSRASADWLAVDLCFQGFERELSSLPGAYAPPAGRLLLARAGGEVAGCVALRPLEPGMCEMKRLWVEPGFAGTGIGRALVETSIEAARASGRCVSIPRRRACPPPSISTRASAFARARRATMTRSTAW